jgi:uncharacterized protein (TIGR00251 family)
MVRGGSRAVSGSNPWLALGDNGVTIEIVARPGASRRRFVRLDPRGLIVALNSVPEKGKANDELIEYLARELKVARSAIAIKRGGTSQHKTVRIEPCDPALIAGRLEALIRTAS